MKRIAITGASGHLGAALVNELLNQEGIEIRAQFHSQNPPFTGNNLTWIKGDLSINSLNELIAGSDYVIHSAALISITGPQKGKVFETNVNGTKRVVEVCQTNKVKRLVHVSSSHALMETPASGVYDETRPYKKESDFAYDFSKATADQFVLETVKNTDLDAFIVRPSSMIGPYDYKPSLLGAAIFDISKRKVPAMIKGGYNFVDVRDVAKAIIQSLEKGKRGESYNLTGTYFEMKELSKVVATISGVKPPRWMVPEFVIKIALPFIALQTKISKKQPKFTKESLHALKHGHRNMSNDKAKMELGLETRPIEESLSDLLIWMNESKS